MPRELKITLGEMRSSGPRRLLVYCGDYKCAYSVIINVDRWPRPPVRPGAEVYLSGLRHRGARCPAA